MTKRGGVVGNRISSKTWAERFKGKQIAKQKIKEQRERKKLEQDPEK